MRASQFVSEFVDLMFSLRRSILCGEQLGFEHSKRDHWPRSPPQQKIALPRPPRALLRRQPQPVGLPQRR